MAKMKTSKAEGEAEAPKPGLYTLRRDRTDEFRRTINYKLGVSAQLVFQPGSDLDLTAEEVAGLQKEIEVGLIVPTDRDEKGRQRVVREVTTEAKATIESLQKQVEDLTAENAQLKADLEKATTPE